MNKIGVMQGRLLPKYHGRYQAHPINYWKNEFIIANEIGLDCIEFIFDYNDANMNPLLRDDGIKEIKTAVEQSLVEVKTVCADYFMEAPLHSYNSSIVKTSQAVMKKLLDNVSKIGVSDIVVPCVDQASLEDRDAVNRLVKNLKPILKIAEDYGINLSLETDLAPEPFVELLSRFSSNRIKVNYDIGNSAALGYDPIEELGAYGEIISDIHIKDRVFGGGPVFLGTGNADFDTFFKGLSKLDYSGPFIMQAYRDNEGVKIFKKQLDWIKRYLNV